MTGAVLALLLALSVPGYVNWQAARAQKQSAQELVSQLRAAQVRAQAEVVTYRVDIQTGGIRTYRVVAGSDSLDSTWSMSGSQVEFGNAHFYDSFGSGSRVWFFPRGTASDGSVEVLRVDSGKVYTVEVEGLTSRVTLSE